MDTSEQWKFELRSLMHEYGKLIQQYHEVSTGFYRQSAFNNYITEDELIDILHKIRALKDQMQQISKDHWPDTSGFLYHKEFVSHCDFQDVKMPIVYNGGYL